MSKTYTLLDNLECKMFSINGNYEESSSFNANGKDITCEDISISNSFEQSLTVLMGSGVWETKLFYVGSGEVVVITPETSTIKIVGEEGGFAGGGQTFNNLWITEGVSMTIYGNNTFNDLKIDLGANINFGETTTTFSSLSATGTAENLILMQTGIFSKSSGVVVCDYLSLENMIAEGGAMWYAGSHSIDGGDNSGWLFRNKKYPLPARPWKA